MLEGATLDGVRSAGGFVNGGWTGLVRLFTVPDLGRGVREEYDYKAAGSRFRIPEEMADMSVNGYPAAYRVFRAPSGKAYTEFVWFTDTKHFRVMIDGQIAKSSDAFVRVQRLMETLI